MSIRYDFAPIMGYEETPEGWLRVWCRAARTGVQEYKQKDGSVRREYRPPEEVGSPKSLETFGMVPVTLEHPPVLLDSKNTKDHQIGYSGSKVEFDGKFVSVALTVTDSDAIAAIKRGDKKEVSAGYKVEYDAKPGKTPDGEAYDGIQRDIVANHIAVVAKGRAGSDVRLLMDRLDSEDAISADFLTTNFDARATLNSANSKDASTMARITLDSVELEVPNEVAGPIQQFVNDSLRTQEDLVSRIEELQSALEDAQTQYNELYAESESAQGKLDAMSEHIEEMEGLLQEGGGFNMDAIDELVDDRLALLEHLAPALDPELDYRGASARDLYEHAYMNIFGDERSDSEEDISEYDDGYLMGAVDAALANFDPDEEGDEDEGYTTDSYDYSGELDAAMNRRSGLPASPIASYQQRLTAAWQQPLTAVRK